MAETHNQGAEPDEPNPQCDTRHQEAVDALAFLRICADRLPKTEAEFRGRVLDHLRGASCFFAMRYFTDEQLEASGLKRDPGALSILPETDSGFAMDDKTVGAIWTILAAAELKIEDAPIVRCESRVHDRIAQHEAAVMARGDNRFQAILSRTVRPREQRP